MCQTIHLTPRCLIFHRLGHCCRACLVDDVVIKVKLPAPSDYKFSEMRIRADHHPGAPGPQYVGEHPNVTTIPSQSFVPMRICRKRESAGAFDAETGAFVHCKLLILFVADIHTPLRVD